MFSQDLASAAMLMLGVLLLMMLGRRSRRTAARAHAAAVGRRSASCSRVRESDRRTAGCDRCYASSAAAAADPGAVDAWRRAVDRLSGRPAVGARSAAPDLSRLSPLAGLKRIFSLRAPCGLASDLLKCSSLPCVAVTCCGRGGTRCCGRAGSTCRDLAKFLIDISLSTALWVGAALLILAIFDYGLQRWKHEQDLRMTHQEVREEMKNLQGDPQIIARRRAIQRQMVMNRISTSVPKADVVITNPTELAVAIQYDPQKMAAPVVVAKGAGVLAQRIRRLALENNIPSSSESRWLSCCTKKSTSTPDSDRATRRWPKCWRTCTSSRARRCRCRRACVSAG